MLSIGKIALGQQRYYEVQVAHGADDYYSGRGEAPGEWVGAGAGPLGLEGQVSGEQFSALIAGRNPRHPAERLRSSARNPEIAALDLTFSAPKSVSVLAAVGPDEVTRELVLAHEEALRGALSYLEDRAVLVRRGHRGERVAAGEGLIAAAYRHRMSRALDPQLHTHVVAANLTRGPDGRFTALHGAPLYRAAKTAGYLYQAHLRAGVGDRLGLEWGEVRSGAAELVGVPEAVLSEFSKRRHEMLRAAARGGIGLDTKAAAEKAAVATRECKQYGVDTHTWREEVQARAGELGLGREHVARMLAAGRERLASGSPAHDVTDERGLGDRLAGPMGLTERANAFDERAVLQEFAAAAGQGASVEAVRGQARRFAGRADVLATTRGELTTVDLVDCERRLIAASLGRAGERVGLVDGEAVDRTIAQAARPLTAQQGVVVRAVATSGRGVDVVEALAGTGKTYTAGVLRAVYEDAGYAVLGVAPTGRGARELTERAGIPARTVDRLLIDLDQLGDELPRRAVIVLDEAGMAPTRTTARLLEAAEHAGAKVIAIGDPGQLASVAAGGWLRTVGRELGSLELTEVMRQRDPAERRALAALHERIPGRYLEWAQREGRIETFDDAAGAHGRALQHWATAVDEAGVDRVVMIARDNDTRAALNASARELRRDRRALGEQRTYGARELAVGDRVICRRNDGALDVDNGTRGTVRHLDRDRVVLETDSRLVRELPASYVSEHVEHAYALTGHGMQGGTVETAIVVAAPRDLSAGWSYTALSRARDSTRLVIHDDRPAHERTDVAPQQRPRITDHDKLLATVQQRMIERDDEDLAIEQLPPAGAADDHRLARARDHAGEPAQEHAAFGAEASSETSGAARLPELDERLARLAEQRAALPAAHLRQLDDLHARSVALAAKRADLLTRLESVPEPTRSLLGRARDPHVIDRVRLASAITGTDLEIGATRDALSELHARLGDPEQIRGELDGLDRAMTSLATERAVLLDELVTREAQAPDDWAHALLGQRPADARAEVWDRAIHRVARYRLQYRITDTTEPLGPEPQKPGQRGEWQRAHEIVENAERRLGRILDRGIDLDIGR